MKFDQLINMDIDHLKEIWFKKYHNKWYVWTAIFCVVSVPFLLLVFSIGSSTKNTKQKEREWQNLELKQREEETKRNRHAALCLSIREGSPHHPSKPSKPVEPVYSPPERPVYSGAKMVTGRVRRCYLDGVALESGGKLYFLADAKCPDVPILYGYIEETWREVELDFGRSGRKAIVAIISDKEKAQDDRKEFRKDVANYPKELANYKKKYKEEKELYAKNIKLYPKLLFEYDMEMKQYEIKIKEYQEKLKTNNCN